MAGNGAIAASDRLPLAPEAERLTLGSIIAFPDCAPDVFRKLHARDFVDAAHQAIYAAMLSQHGRGLAVDPPLLAAELKSHPEFADGSSHGYLLELGQAVVTVAHVGHYAEQVVEASRKRRLASIAEAAAESALNGQSANNVFHALMGDLDDFRREAQAIDQQPREKFTLADLRHEYPHLHPPIVDGLFRAGETVNIIASSKMGKSWFAYYLAICIITGRYVFGKYATSRGKVLLVDNELHRSTLAHRIPVVGEAMGIPASEYQDDLDVWPLRGNLRSLADLAAEFDEVQPGNYKLILLDALYRFNIAGVSENDNATMAAMYNTLDRIADKTKSAIVLIHHATKGSQSEKRITDVGAGAGAQSRAADCHLILREHEEAGVIVLEAAVRSFAPVEPLALRWQFPLWLPADDIDPSKLKGKLSPKQQQQSQEDREGIDAIIKALRDGPATSSQLGPKTGISRDRRKRLLDWLCSLDQITAAETTKRGNTCYVYSLNKSDD